MDESNKAQNRRSRRSNVLMAATLELSGTSLAVKLRNLSAEGALVEGESLPLEGTGVLFRRNELAVPGRIAWVQGTRAGVTFTEQLAPEALLHHIPAPKPRVVNEYRRPGLAARELSPEERKFGEAWVWQKTKPIGD